MPNNYNLYQKKYKGVSKECKPKYDKTIDYSKIDDKPEQDKMLWFKMHYFIVQNRISKDNVTSGILNLFNRNYRNKKRMYNSNITFKELKKLILYYFDFVEENDIDFLLMCEFDLEKEECKIDEIIRKGEL